eukprot:scaffold6468_cov147-Skeletonema_dohrnii-CCMP3373.AAC.1
MALSNSASAKWTDEHMIVLCEDSGNKLGSWDIGFLRVIVLCEDMAVPYKTVNFVLPTILDTRSTY